MVLPRKYPTVATKAMGRGLMLTGAAFAVWSIAISLKPDQDSLVFWVGIGATTFIVALIFCVQAAISRFSSKTRGVLLSLGLLYTLSLLFVRTTLPSNPGFSADGLFFFQPHDVVKFMYVVIMVAVILPAIQIVADDIRSKSVLTARVISGSLMANTIGGILLIVSVMGAQDTLMYLVGWGMMIATSFLLLASFGLFQRTKKPHSY